MIEKIDVINEVIYVYDNNFDLVKNINLNDLQGLDLTYLDGSKLFTFNITQPIKRVVKFSEINGLNSNAEFTEFIYDEMTDKQKLDFDNFVQLVENV
jgi:hypothetical protein